MAEMERIDEILLRELPRLRARIVPSGRKVSLDADGLPLDRRICPDCLGRGQPTCRRCGGTGLVCPYCRGYRVLRQEDDLNPLLRLPQVACKACTDWWDRQAKDRYGQQGRIEFAVDRRREAMAIVRWSREQGVSDADSRAVVTGNGG